MPPIPLGGFILIGPPMFGCPIKHAIQISTKVILQSENTLFSFIIALHRSVSKAGGRYLVVWLGPNCLAGVVVTLELLQEAKGSTKR